MHVGTFQMLLVLVGTATIVTGKMVGSDVMTLPKKGQIRYFYDDGHVDEHACGSLVVLGVGTAMTVNDYEDLASRISWNNDIVTVVSDHAPNWIAKTSHKAYADLTVALIKNLDDLIPPCKSSSPSIFIGGHSSSGMAAVMALPLLDFVPSGFIGFDPFNFNSPPSISIPAMVWGFSDTTCAVDVDKAAKAAYQGSNPKHRVFFQIQNHHEIVLTHCSFTDKGCEMICPEREGSDDVRVAAGNSAQRFVSVVLASSSYSKHLFEDAVAGIDLDVDIFVNEEQPDNIRSPTERTEVK